MVFCVFWIAKSHDPQMVCSTHLFSTNRHIQTYPDFHSAPLLYAESKVVENLFLIIERIVTSEEDRVKERAVVLEIRSIRKSIQKPQKTWVTTTT